MISDFRPRSLMRARPTFKYEPIQSIRQQGRTAKAENEKAIRETTPLQGRARANPNIQGNDLSRLHVYTQDQCESITIRPTSHAANWSGLQGSAEALLCQQLSDTLRFFFYFAKCAAPSCSQMVPSPLLLPPSRMIHWSGLRGLRAPRISAPGSSSQSLGAPERGHARS